MKRHLCFFALGLLALFSGRSSLAAPINNNFASAIALSGPVVTTTGSNVGANKEFFEPNHAGNAGGASVWWTWTPSVGGQTTIDTSGSDFNTLLAVYTGNGFGGFGQPGLTTIASNNDFNGNTTSQVQFNAVAGTVYRIAVDGFRPSGFGSRPAQGNITLHIVGPGGATISSPANGTVFTVGDSIPVTVNIESSFPNPPASRVDFYRGGTLFGSSSNAPFSAIATNSPAGSNAFYVVAFDSTGQGYQSPTVKVLVQNIGATLLTPAQDAMFLNANPIGVTAWGYLPSGSITNIDFYVDGLKFASGGTAPFSGTWSNVTGGSHRFTAIGTSDSGASYVSQPVNIGVATLLVQSNAVWKYLDNGSNQGTNWLAPGFDDSGWASGPAPLGYGDANGIFPVTTNSYGLDASNKFTTTYFRRSVTVSNVAAYTNIAMRVQRDDGIIVYLNGAEVFRQNMPLGAVTYTTFASTVIGGADENTWYSTNLSGQQFVEGANVFAVEVHQSDLTSSDLWFVMDLMGIPIIIHNLSPNVALTTPTNDAYFLSVPIPLSATASDDDGSVAKVEFLADGVKVGEDTTDPYTSSWDNPSVGPHLLSAVATDDQGAQTESARVPVMVYDSVGTPYIRITSPADGAAFEGGTNLLLTVFAKAPTGVTNVQYFVNGSSIGNSSTPPFSFVFDAPFGTNSVYATVFDATGASAASPAITIIAYPNTVAPFILTNFPPRFTNVTNLTNITIVFSEPVQNVDAGDMLLNGTPATGVTGSGSTYVFSFPQPPYGEVEIAWINGHGITDFGYPTNLPFNELGQDAQWEYQLIDKTPPTIAARTPAPGSTVSNLSQISVTFSEYVTNVDAADLLVNGVAALSMTGGGSNYVFTVTQPSAGTVNITWATTNGILDLADTPNSFNRTNGAWSFTLDTRVFLVQSNSNWQFVKGLAEASTPSSDWRQLGFDDSSWSNSQAPFFYGDPYTNFPAGIFGTQLTDMRSNYSTIFLRQNFIVNTRGSITNVVLSHQTDDGLIAWLNGVEVWRYNVPSGDLAYNATASAAANEPNNAGAAYIVVTLTNAAVSRLVDGTNTLAIMAFNQTLTDGDFGFNAQLYYYPIDATVVPPRLISANPAPGDLFYLTNVTISFSEGVSGVDASDLLVNGVPASDVSSATNTTYTFSFPQPAYGAVSLTWATDHGIADFDNPPKAFNGTAASSLLNYTLLNPSSPRIVTQMPLANTTITGLTSITITFTEPVTGVDASDLLVSGIPADSVNSADGITYAFSFPQPAFGAVTVRWAVNHSITDLEVPPAPFDPSRFGGQWNYTLVNPVPSVTLTSPTNNAFVLAPANVPLRATALDNDGTVSLVEFYQDSNKVGEVPATPYSLTLSNVPLGVYVYQAVATDNSGLRGTSAPVVLNVVTSLPVVLLRGPYLQIGSPTGAVVRWRSDLASDSAVFYGPDPSSLTNIANDATKTNEHIVTISGLQPETRYYYSIGSAGQRLAGTNGIGSDYFFNTSPLAGTKKHARLWVVGDSGTAGNGAPDRVNSVKNAFYNLAATNGAADMFLMLGDNAYNSGLDTEYQAAVFDIFPTLLRNTFLWPTIGNHESNQSTTANDFPYLNIFSLPHNGEAGGLPSGTQKYYSFDYANIHLICLDSETSGYTTNTAMFQWMIDDLKAATADWIIVFFHHPPYTHGTHNSDTESDLIQIRTNFIPVLEDFGVDLVLNGHSHVHERSFLLDRHYGLSSTFSETNKIDGGSGREDGTGAYRKNSAGRGVVYNVCGCSGQALGGTLDHPAHFLSLNELGSLVIDVNKGRLDVRFLTTSGDFSDHYTLVKERLPAAPVGLAARPGGPDSVLLSWMNAATNATGFILERSTDGVDYTRFATNTVDVTNAVDGGLLANLTYFYRVRAIGEGGESGPSGLASVTTVPGLTPPEAPSSLVANSGEGSGQPLTQIVLHWRDNSTNEAGFLLERATDGDPFLALATVGANITFYTDYNLAQASSYNYRVRSFNSAGESAPATLGDSQTLPQDNVVVLGGTATFHAGNAGSYQWRFMGLAIDGATNETLMVTNAKATDEGPYTVELSGALSNPAWLFVLASPVIVEQPASRTNLSGTTAIFHVTANGSSPLVYQWRKDGAILAGANGDQLTVSPIAAADQANYDVLVFNSLGATTSQVARLVINTAPIAGADHLFGFSYQPLSISSVTLLANDSDPDGDALSITSVGPNSTQGGTVSLAGQTVFFSAPAGFTGDDTFTYVLTDARGASVPGSVTVSVSGNHPPTFAPVSDMVANVLVPLTLTNPATDPDVGNRLTYSLAPGAPTNALIDPNNATLRWTPTRQQAASTNTITLRVADNGVPALSNSVSFVVYVNDYIETTLGTAAIAAGESTNVAIDIFSSAAISDSQCALLLPADRITNATVTALLPETAAVALQEQNPGNFLLTLTAMPGQMLQGTQHLARLNFSAVSNQSSAFVPLHISSLAGTRATAGMTPSTVANDGRVVIVGDQPLLETLPANNGNRQLMFYGKRNSTNRIQYATRLGTDVVWTNRATITISTSNQYRVLPVGNTPLPPVFYRVQSP